VFLASTRQFKRAAELLLDAIATFTRCVGVGMHVRGGEWWGACVVCRVLVATPNSALPGALARRNTCGLHVYRPPNPLCLPQTEHPALPCPAVPCPAAAS
jgi:hypothetical protein